MRRRITIAILALGAGALALAPILVPAWIARKPIDAAPYLDVHASSSIEDATGRTLYAFLNPDDHWCFPVALDNVSPYLVKATIAAEDQRFYDHDGVDRSAIARAVWQNATNAGIHSGASTITMQLVKLADDLPRSVPGKVEQAARALQLERNANKNQILEAYLNRAAYGYNLLGCEAASQRFFGKSAKELTLPEAALLAALPKAPSALNPVNNAERAQARRDYVLDRMVAEALITPNDAAAAKETPVAAAWHAFPGQSPHFAMRLQAAATEQHAIQTTLRASVQTTVETLLAKHVEDLGETITNGAAIVIDTETADVIARAGSAAFFDTPGGGQVDALRANRSPGSALKPFTYALAMERNLLYPSEKLLDGTLDFGLYRPQNYDGKARGLISASYALRRSLNVPAVMVQERIGTIELAHFLERCGITTLQRRPTHYGIGLTLGNCEVRLEELATAYCAIATLGEYRPLREIATDPASEGDRVMSEGTAAAIYAMLEQPLPGDFERDTVIAGRQPLRVALKTGTSTGQRDAWSIVFNRHYVVGVWVGNNDGSRSNGLVGAQAALPLAARIFRALPQKPTPAWPDPSGRLHNVDVCAATGLPATQWCPYHTQSEFPIDQLVMRKCAVHGPDSKERWPDTSRGWDLAKRADTPEQNVDPIERPLSIVEPANDAEFVLTGEPNADQIRLASTYDDRGDVFWYVNGKFEGRAKAHTPVQWALTPGTHNISCMTENGEEASATVTVSTPYRPKRFEE